MFSKSKRFGDNLQGASGPGPTTYNIKRLFDDGRAQQPKQRALVRKALPVLLGKKPPMFSCKKPVSNDSSKVESKNSNDWLDHFDCNGLIAQGATGLVFAATLKAQGTPCGLKRILKKDSNEKMVSEFFREFEILKSCQHPNVVTVFSFYEVPVPAFIMELLGKTLQQSTEQGIDNNGVLVAFKNAAAAVQYLHSRSIAHRDIKPSNFCHLHCQTWEIKLIDFDAAEELKESCWFLFNFNFEILTL